MKTKTCANCGEKLTQDEIDYNTFAGDEPWCFSCMDLEGSEYD